MMREVLAATSNTAPAIVALVFFVSFFLAMLLWIFRSGSRRTYDQMSWMPLDGGAVSGAVVSGEEGRNGQGG